MNSNFTPWPEEITAQYRDKGYWSDETFGEMLDRLLPRHGDDIAVTDGTNWLSYRSLSDRSWRVADGLRRRGLRRGDVVVVQASNSCEYLVVLFSLFRLGAIPVCALPAHRESEIGYFCSHTEAAAYVYPDGEEYQKLASAIAPRVRLSLTLSQAAALDGDPTAITDGPGADDVALLQLSGGSTGVPKLIPRTHNDYMYSVNIAAEVCELDESTVYLCALPVAHNFPLSSPGALGVLYAGGTVVMAADPSPDTCFPLIQSEQVTITAVVPAVALLWIRAASQRGTELPSLRVLQVGGARLDDADARGVAPALGARLQQVFGMAEGLVCYTRYDDQFDTICGTQGLPASPADEVRIVDDNDRDVPEGHSGHLLTRGPYTVRGYYRADAHNATAFTADGHYYRTGDIVRRTSTGHLVVTGRAKDQVNRGGEKIAAAEIEEHLRVHPDIHDAALVAAADPVLGERSCAFCVTGTRLSAANVRGFLRERGLAAYKIPDLVRFVDQLPRTPVGKIDKKKLKESLDR